MSVKPALSALPRSPTPQQVSRRDWAISAAIDLVERDGVEALTMPALASALDVPPERLVPLFPNREDLLDGIVDAFVDEMFADPEAEPQTADWPEFLLRTAHALRRAALTHPHVFPLMVTRAPAAPWLHPPLRSLRWTEAFLQKLNRCGFSDHAAAIAYRAFFACVLGHVLLEVATLQTSPESADVAYDGSPNLAQFPRLAGVRQELAADLAQEEFEDALDSLLDRLHP